MIRNRLNEIALAVRTWTCIRINADTSEADADFIWRDLMNGILAEFGTKVVLLVAIRRCQLEVSGVNGIFLAMPQVAQLPYESRLWFWENTFGQFGNETACDREEKHAAPRKGVASVCLKMGSLSVL